MAATPAQIWLCGRGAGVSLKIKVSTKTKGGKKRSLTKNKWLVKMWQWIFHRLLRPRMCTHALTKLSASFLSPLQPLPLPSSLRGPPASLPRPRPDVGTWTTAQTPPRPKFACYPFNCPSLSLVHWPCALQFGQQAPLKNVCKREKNDLLSQRKGV